MARKIVNRFATVPLRATRSNMMSVEIAEKILWSGLPCSTCSPTFGPARVGIVVVYKVDRLTRSLADFALRGDLR
jgi:hypothetical protein